MSLKGKVIAITGAASGIGLALSQLLAAEGATLSLADQDQPTLDRVAASLAQKGIQVMATTLDVRSQSDVDAWIASTVQAFGRLDGAANMAGIFRRSGLILDSDNAEFEGMMAVNFYGVLNCVRAQMRAMKENGGKAGGKVPGGSIVNAGSTASLQGGPTYASYIASKHAVLGLTRTASREAAPMGIRVNAVCPSVVRTNMATKHEEENSFKFTTGHLPMKRLAEAEEVAKAVRFLLSEDSSYINGAAQVIDGGLSASL